jgi:hypothetical protein
MSYAITNIAAANALPLVVSPENPPQAAPVQIYEAVGGVIGPALFALLGQTDPTQLGVAALNITFSIPPGSLQGDANVMMVGTCALGQLAGMATIPDGATTFTIFVAVTPEIDTAGRFFLCSPITWRLHYQGGCEGPPPPTILFTQPTPLELYFGPKAEVAEDMAVDTVRLNVARDLAQPFLASSTVPAACAQGAFLSPPVYPAVGQNSNYGGYDNFELTDWLFALSGLTNPPLPADCADAAGMCCLMLQLQPNSGLQQVWAGYIQPAGFLFPTMLRGATEPTGDKYSFNYHYVSVFTSGGDTWVCDATMGPHLGNEAPATYLTNVFDLKDYPHAAEPGPPSGWGVPPTPLSFRSRQCPVSVDGVAFPPSSINLERPPALMAGRKAFAERLGLPSPPAMPRLVSDAALDAAIGGPQLAALPLVHQRLSPGAVTRRYRVFSDGARQLHLKVWRSAQDAGGARDRFLDEGALGEDGHPYAPCAQLGEAAGVRAWDGGGERLWLFENLAIRLTAIGEGLDVGGIARDLQEALSNSL